MVMKQALLVVVVCAAGIAAPLRFEEGAFTAAADGRPAGWTVWSARAETAPRAFVDPLRYRTKPGSLAISGNSNLAEHGGWERRVDGVSPGAWYRFAAFYRAEAVAAPSWQIAARLDWRGADGKRVGMPDYIYRSAAEGDWTKVWSEAQAPEKAAFVVVQLHLSNAPQGTVWWSDLSLEQIPDPGPRAVSLASINLRPARTKSAEENVRLFIETIDAKVPAKTDVIVLPEGITVVGNGKAYPDVAETIPGPTTKSLGEVARKRSAYIVAGIYEREGPAIYNTAVLIDRKGNVAGKYRKVYLPREEVEAGLTPGSDYPVFRTDFGTVGIMICYDVFFPDPARALALKGAEMILMPIWGGDETLAKARAIDNKVFLIASGYDHPTYIMDPDGERLSVGQRPGAAVATVDLNKRYMEKWLGEMKARRPKEIRVDVK
jgi:predicted amidohydrolase